MFNKGKKTNHTLPKLEKLDIMAFEHDDNEVRASNLVKEHSAIFKRIAKILLTNRNYLGIRLLINITKNGKWHHREFYKSRLPDHIENVLEQQIIPLVYFLNNYFVRGDLNFRDLYIGEKYSHLIDLNVPSQENKNQIKKILSDDKKVYIRLLKNNLLQEDLVYFEKVIDEIHQAIINEGSTIIKILFIGDCLYTDILDFLIATCFTDSISISYKVLGSRNPEELNDSLIKLSKENFNMVFFSPFTYEFLREYDYILDSRHIYINSLDLNNMIDNIINEASQVIKTLGTIFDCPIIVHNCSGERRLEKNNVVIAAMCNLVTHGRRKKTKEKINHWLEIFISKMNNDTFNHIFMLDEDSVIRKKRHGMNRYLYYKPVKGYILHIGSWGPFLAQFYRDIIYTQVNLINKKVVVCDLDNTLWKGIIGEGEVIPYCDKQFILRTLKEKGVLLAINSKNNETNISWKNNILSGDDFAAVQINWDSKANNIAKIQQELRLKTKDFIFLDDLSIEREIVKSVYPEICVLDSLSNNTWQLLRLWAVMLGNGPTKDRTALYKEEKEREKIVSTKQAKKHDLTESLIKLEMSITVRMAKRSDLERVKELINRTNQFNLCGSRVSFNELVSWHQSPNHKIVLAEAKDKLGDLGIICTALIESTLDSIHVPIFVLSCRAIGYKMEVPVLNYIRQMAVQSASDSKDVPITGSYKETAYNEPCRTMYPDNGFTMQEDGSWRSSKTEIPNPRWLSVNFQLT